MLTLIDVHMMRVYDFLLCTAAVCLCLSCSVRNEDPAQGMTQPVETVHLYPKGQNSDAGIVEDGVAVTLGPAESNQIDTVEFFWDADGSLNNVSDSARIEIYLPEHRNGIMLVVCPGGGYSELTYRGEGLYAAQLLTQKGYSVAVLCYRMPVGHPVIPLTDVQNAFRYCRYHAQEWGIHKIGVVGGSAGGHLAASASTLYVDDITRPDFTVLYYPAISAAGGMKSSTIRRLTGGDAELMEYYSLENRVTSDTPPALLFHSTDDKTTDPENSMRYYRALRAAGVHAELYCFPHGGHGWAFTTQETAGKDKLGEYRATSSELLYRFLESQKDWDD